MSWQLDFTEFQTLFKNLESVKDRIPELKQEFMNQLGVEMLAIVHDRIRGEGKVKSWQEYQVGNRYGYSVVRPKKDTYQNSRNRKYLVGFITTKIENGHRIRSPSGRDKDYSYRGGAAQRVPGRYFYKEAQTIVNSFAEKAANGFAKKIARRIEEELSK